MKSMRKLLIAYGLLIAAAFPAFAQFEQQMPMMNNGIVGAGTMMRQGDLKTMLEGRLAYTKSALGITDDEAAAWRAYEDAMRTNVQSMQPAYQAMMTAMQSGSAIDRMQTHINMMQGRLDALKALQPATEALYKALTPGQQKKADALLGMGGGMM